MTSLAAALLVLATALTGTAQAPADFSGTWTAEVASPASGGAPAPPRAGDMGSGWGSSLTITQNAKQLVVETAVYSRYDLQPQPQLVYLLDGSESRNTLMLGRGFQELRSRAAWEGAALKLTTLHTFTDPASDKPQTYEISQRLSLESPTRLIVEVTRAGALGGKPSSTTTAFTKR